MIKFKSREIAIRNKLMPAIFIGITISLTIYFLSILHIYIIPIAKFIVFSSFASSSFLIYMIPKSKSSRISKFVKSYIIAGIIGILGFYMSLHINIYYTLAMIETLIAILLVIFSAEHPPAMGIGVVFILERAYYFALIFLLTGVLIIIALNFILKEFVYIAEDELE